MNVYMTDEMKSKLPVLVTILRTLSKDCYFTLSTGAGNSPEVQLQANSQELVRRWRALFPGFRWAKKVHDTLKWWEYSTDYAGVAIVIYGCMEAPPTCRLERRTEMVEEEFPIAYETRMVSKEVIEWKCDGEVVEEEV